MSFALSENNIFVFFWNISKINNAINENAEEKNKSSINVDVSNAILNAEATVDHRIIAERANIVARLCIIL